MTSTPNPLGPSRYFPDPDEIENDYGIVALGLPLRREILVDAYSHGIFPWPHGRGAVPWCSPDPRAVLPLESPHWSRRLLRTVRSGKFEVSFNRDFAAVIRACATTGNRTNEMWITPAMRRAYINLHETGLAHSVETRLDGVLVGGTYGVAIRGLFAGESMFHLVTDASTVAIHHLCEHLRARGFSLFDIQMLTPHTARFGAVEISRAEYVRRLHAALKLKNVRFHDGPEPPAPPS
ncbi:MAG TPA: leucyl/phenylalanyl-tRNA--protein transferase [Planctomycetaceae bacterium]|nr:leucyl/phenylalanyl-tRNA--protein transferase [Planctomycetaceae bacterium]